jgi:hypothetical protein
MNFGSNVAIFATVGAKIRRYDGFVRRLIDEYWGTPHMGNMDKTNARGVMSA